MGDSYSRCYSVPSLDLNSTLATRSDNDGRIKTVKNTVDTNRVHGAVCSRQVQVDQAVGLGQEQVQVLNGGRERLSFRGQI